MGRILMFLTAQYKVEAPRMVTLPQAHNQAVSFT